MPNLSGKVAIVTGTAGKRGMGRAIAVRLAGDGADVAIVDLAQPVHTMSQDWQGLDSVADEIRALGRTALAIRADVGRTADIQEIVRQTQTELGRIDILVNNAAVRMNPNNTPVVDIEEADWERVLRVNLTGTATSSRSPDLTIDRRPA